jgi:hypothetical protein
MIDDKIFANLISYEYINPFQLINDNLNNEVINYELRKLKYSKQVLFHFKIDPLQNIISIIKCIKFIKSSITGLIRQENSNSWKKIPIINV